MEQLTPDKNILIKTDPKKEDEKSVIHKYLINIDTKNVDNNEALDKLEAELTKILKRDDGEQIAEEITDAIYKAWMQARDKNYYANRCMDAAKAVGHELLNGNEENVLSTDQANYHTAISKSFPGKKLDFHVVGILDIPEKNKKKSVQIVIDITHDTVQGTTKPIAIIVREGTTEQILENLKDIYGSGKWSLDMSLNKKDNNYKVTH